MISKIDAFKLLPLRLGLMRIGVGWRFLLSVAVMAAYMVASRAIYHAEDLSFAQIELLRTPFRLAGAILFWLLMADMIFETKSDVRPLRTPGFIFAIGVALLVPLLITVEGSTGRNALIIAAASVPVALYEEFFFRILQTLLVRHLGALLGIGLPFPITPAIGTVQTSICVLFGLTKESAY